MALNLLRVDLRRRRRLGVDVAHVDLLRHALRVGTYDVRALIAGTDPDVVLVDARHDEPMPDVVAARLDRVLAGQRLRTYKRISSAESEQALMEIHAEIEDRYGHESAEGVRGDSANNVQKPATLETGKVIPALATLSKIANALGIRVSAPAASG